MEEFYPDQRWTSDAEPELGLGIVVEVSKGRVRIDFPFSGETRLYAAGVAPLRRVRFREGDKIEDRNGRSFVVDEVEEQGDLLVYWAQGRALPEASLGNVNLKFGAEDKLMQGEVEEPRIFDLRRRTLQYDHKRRISPVNGFVGGRIDLIPHQLYIAHEVSSRYAPRVLLSDEVGLGKTIEACLILHRLLRNGRISRALILVPDSLVHQWFVEVLRRFNLWFQIFDEERAQAVEEGAPDGNPFLDDQLILCSTSFLANSRKRTSQALQANWDILVVDEAHHLAWSPEEASPEYQVVELLSQRATGLLLLTATPEQLGEESHFARLRLLDPDRYPDFEAFQKESRHQKETADIVGKLDEGEPLNGKEIALLEKRFGKGRMKEIEEGNEEERAAFMRDVLDQYGPGRVIFRNRRAAMKGFPTRIPELAPLRAKENHDYWVERVSKEVSDDPLPKREWKVVGFRKDPRLEWLLKLMQELHPAKVLLICKTKEKVKALEAAIGERIRLKVGVFHEDLNLVQRDRNAAWFAEPDGARLLICSEIGSEGRNFQFAQHLVLFDLPENPELLEQRIGRLDRIGQTRDIHIHVPFIEGSAQEALVRWYHDGLDAFRVNLEGGDRLYRTFGVELRVLAVELASTQDPAKLNDLVDKTRKFYEKHRARLRDGRDRLLEMNSFDPEIASELIGKIQEEDRRSDLEAYMMEVFDHFLIEVEDLDPRTYLLRPPHGNAVTFPGIPDEGIMVTFDRDRALSREDVGFLTWDHPMVTGTIDLMLSSGTGSTSYAILPKPGASGMLLEAVFVLETSGGDNNSVDRFLPNTPLRLVVNHTGMEVTEQYPEEMLEQDLRPGFMEDLMENEVLMETILPNMLKAAGEIAEEMAERKIASGLHKMRSTLNREIQRLRSLQEKNNHIRPEEIELAQKVRDEFSNLIMDAQVRLDSVQLIRKGRT